MNAMGTKRTGRINFILMVGLACFVMAACGVQKENLDFAVQPVVYQLNLGKGETENLCYADEKKQSLQ